MLEGNGMGIAGAKGETWQHECDKAGTKTGKFGAQREDMTVGYEGLSDSSSLAPGYVRSDKIMLQPPGI